MSEPRMPAQGLTSAEVLAARAAHGRNELPQPRRRSHLLRFVGELVHFFALMLWVAAGLAVVAGMVALAAAISLVVVVNAVFSFAQEARADRAAERLRALLPTKVTVRRDGVPTTIDAIDVVVGDLLLLEAGDRVPADATIAFANQLLLDRSMLTGESVPASMEADECAHAGTFVVEGVAEAVVDRVGAATRLAAISQLTTGVAKPPTPMALGLRSVVRLIAVIAVGVGAAFFGISLWLGNSASEGFIFAIGVTVALVPEALLPTVTLSLAWGAEQMAKRQVLVRHMEAVETLGSVTFVCTDKTGTLTRNEMSVVEAWTPAGAAEIDGVGYEATAEVRAEASAHPAIEALALAAARCGTGFVSVTEGVWRPHGDPMEAALDAFARRLDVDVDGDRGRRVEVVRFPFDHHRRRMSVVVGDEVIVKGAPDSVLALCGDVDGSAGAAVDAYTSRGLRVLAVARRTWVAVDSPEASTVEIGLELLGIVALQDPPRSEVAPAIAACRRAGVKLAMVTGDHPETAAAIGSQVGLRRPDDPVLTGDDLPDDLGALGALLDHDGIVIARVSPEDKLRIAQALQARGHIVAMTGDGVNDAPALHAADIGIAMGRSGTDVAREAADLVLLDDSFASIVAGIEQGRATFVNVRRFLTYHLTDNVAELMPFVVWMLSGGSFPLALGVLQILALDIGTDTLSAVALGSEAPSAHLLDGPPMSGRLMNRTVLRRAFGVLGPTITAVSMLAFVASLVAQGWRPGGTLPSAAGIAAASGSAFLAVVLGQKANAFACRSSTRRPGELGWGTNRLLLWSTAIELTFAAMVVFVGPIARELDHQGPLLVGWLIAFAAIPMVLTVDAWDKRLHRRGSETATAPR
ncbi:MAG: cation-transporting P-type ATPase [Ilumatobacteraceae bacterium]